VIDFTSLVAFQRTSILWRMVFMTASAPAMAQAGSRKHEPGLADRLFIKQGVEVNYAVHIDQRHILSQPNACSFFRDITVNILSGM
jgi:hypothetical protein